MTPFQIGVNYWPARQAMRMWKDFDSGMVREDFARMAEFRLSPVRVFLLWEDFQPEPYRVNLKMLDRLLEVLSHAGDYNTGVWVTLFTGHMSGANWIPQWALSPDGERSAFPVITGGRVADSGIVNQYEDEGLRQAQKKQVMEVAAAICGHPALWGWDLGNEHSNVFRPRDPGHGRQWIAEMAGEIKDRDDSRPVTFGLHQQDLEEDRGIGPADVARGCDLLTMHAYPAYSDWSADRLDPLFPFFLASLAGWLAGGGPVLVSEFGISTGRDPLSVSEEQAAVYASQSLETMRSHGLPGALWWCYSDYDPVLWGTPPFDRLAHERAFGLFRTDGTPKPAALVLAKSSRSPGEGHPPVDWADIEPQEYWKDPGAEIRRLYARFRRNFLP